LIKSINIDVCNIEVNEFDANMIYDKHNGIIWSV